MGRPASRKSRISIGWTRTNVLTKRTQVLLSTVDGEPVIVLVDTLGADKLIDEPAADSGLTMHRRELGGMVLYEVSKLDGPRLLPLFYVPGTD